MERRAAAMWMALLCIFCLTTNATSTSIEKTAISAPSALVSSLEHETSVPVHDNRFVVDKDIQSLQVLINTDDVQSVKILGPAGIEILPLQNSEGVNWQQIDKLYGITLKKPTIGQWEIKGKMLATPKIVVDSSLKMITPDFPNNLFRGETLTISASLTDKNKRITAKDLLSQTQFFATLHNVATLEKYKIFLSDNENKPQGVYRFDYALQTLPGVYRITIDAFSLLFQRQQEQQFYLYDYPATFTSRIISDTNELLVEVDLQGAIMDEPTCRFTALYMGREGEMTGVPLLKIANKKWQLFTPVSDATHKMTLLLNAYTIDRRLVNITFPDVDVFALFQKNLSDVSALWEERWNTFWQQNENRQLSFLLAFSKEKRQENLLFAANKDLPKSAIPLREYRTNEESLLKSWEPFIFSQKPKTVAEEMNSQVAKEQQADRVTKASMATITVTAKVVAKPAPIPPPSPWRKWIIGLLVVFVTLFMGLIAGILWVFQEAKMRGLLAKVQPIVAQLKRIKIRIEPAVSEKAAVPVEATAVPVEATAVPVEAAAVPVEAAAVPVEAAAVPVEAAAVVEAPPAEKAPIESQVPPPEALPPTTNQTPHQGA